LKYEKVFVPLYHINVVTFENNNENLKNYTMRRKLLTILVLLCLTVLSAWGENVQWKSGWCGVTWNPDNKSLMVDGVDAEIHGAMIDYATPGDRPWDYIKADVKEIHITERVSYIGANAFSGFTNATYVVIRPEVTSIGARAFYDCQNLNISTLEGVDLNVTSIGDYAFYHCYKLTKAPFCNKLTSIGTSAFESCKLPEIVIPNSVTTIGERAFTGCSSATKIIIGSGVTTIGNMAFGYPGESLTTIIIGSNVTNIGANSFFESRWVKDVYFYADPSKLTWPDSGNNFAWSGTRVHVYSLSDWSKFVAMNKNTYVGDLAGKGVPDEVLWSYDGAGTMFVSGTGNMADIYQVMACPWDSHKNDITRVVIENGVTSIGAGCFLGYPNLSSVDVHVSMKSIGMNAFRDCQNLKSITLGSNVTTIGSDAFYNCTAMEDVYCYVLPQNHVMSWAVDLKNAFKADGSTKFHVYNVPDWNSISSNVRANFDSYLAGNEAPDRVLWSHDGAGTMTFSGTGNMADYGIIQNRPWHGVQNSITRAVIEEGVASIGASAFYGFDHLASVEIPNTVTSIGISSFYGCSALKSVEISAGMKSIEPGPFLGCSNLATVNIYASSCDASMQPFPSNCKLYVFADKVEGYKTAAFWSAYADKIEALTLTANAGDNEGEYWATYYNDLAECKVDENTKVFKLALTGNMLEMKKIDDGIINLGQGVVLKSKSASIPLYYSATGSATSYGDNSLLGTMTTINNPGNAFVLNKGSHGIGFYKLKDTGTIKAHKAYLTFSGTNAPAFFGFDEDVTGIKTMSDVRSEMEDVWYTIDGRKLCGKPAVKGIYILNGKAVIIN